MNLTVRLRCRDVVGAAVALMAILSLPPAVSAQSTAASRAQEILRQAANSQENARRGIEIPDQGKNQCVVAADAKASALILNGRLDLEKWLAVSTEAQKLAAIQCITKKREALKAAEQQEAARCRPVLVRIAAGMSNERAMAYAMQHQCERFIMP